MTSKRLGIVLAAAIVLWSLAGTSWIAQTTSTWNDELSLVGVAHAGDPDAYEDGNSSEEGTGSDPDASSGGSQLPSDKDDTTDDVVQTLILIVSLIISGTP